MPAVVPAICAKLSRRRSPRTISSEFPFSIHSSSGSPRKATTSARMGMCWNTAPRVTSANVAATVHPMTAMLAVTARTLPATSGRLRARSLGPRR